MATAANPYAGPLADRDPLPVLNETPGRLKEARDRLGAAGLEKSLAPGKWSVGKIFCHLADCEIAFGYRWRQAAAERHHRVQPFDQDLWAAHYDSLSADRALDTFCTLREWNSAWLAKLPKETFSKPASHPERGELTLQTLLETTAGHDLHHLAQIDQIVARENR
jgi:uncharacterized damage-inducible protein DinB